MDAQTVADQGLAAVMRGDPVYINGRVNRTSVLPPRVVRRAVGRSGHQFRKM